MSKKILLPHLVLCFILAVDCKNQVQQSTTKSLINYVDPFIGTSGHGHTYPGATVPFGMIQLSPDNGISGWDWCSGYHISDSIIIGFSHLHLSGTGIGDLADVRLMPVSQPVALDYKITTDKKSKSINEVSHRNHLPYKSSFSHVNEIAVPGYYKVQLDKDHIQVELTTSKYVGYHKYTYQPQSMQSVILDLGFTFNWDNTMQTAIEKEDAYTVSGYRYSKGWANDQKVYFVIAFSKPIKSITMVADGNNVIGNTKASGKNTRAQIVFENQDSNVLDTKVAVSSVSVSNAKLNLASDGESTFERVRNTAAKTWEKALHKIKITTPNDTLKKIFYTALYHSQLAPVTFSDINGEFRRSDGELIKVNHIQYSTLSLWDTFRALHPLLTILDPERVADIIKSMLLYYDEKNILPVWTLYGNETNCMTGYHSIPVIVEAYLKGIRNFDVHKAYKAMKNTMLGSDRGLAQYKKYGYIPWNTLDESVTITLEYAYDDWCVAQMAKALGKIQDYKYFMNRSKAYHHLFDKKTGFMRGKHTDGKSWHTPFDPKYSSHRVHADYTEGNAWQHSWFVLHDVQGLMDLHGGKDNFTDKLQQLFTESSEITGENVSADISGLIGQYAHGNEPSHHIAYMFNSAGKPWKTQYWVREIMKTQYKATADGLSGNEDCGQMSAWYVLSAMGLYPMNPASGIYQIGSPLFESSIIPLQQGKTFEIKAKGVSDKNKYIQSATLNGKTFNRTTLKHQDIIKGGVLEFVMGNEPNKSWAVE